MSDKPGAAAMPGGAQVAAAIGAELATPVARLQQLAQGLRARSQASSAELASLDAAIAEAHRIAVQSQQVARLAGGKLRQSHEKLELHAILHDVLLEHHALFAARGIEARQHLRPVDIIVDPSLLVSLLQTAIQWASERGSRLVVKLSMKNWPENGLLEIKAHRTVVVSGEAPTVRPSDNLLWFLLAQIAQAMGVLVAREANEEGTTVTLEFPRTVRNLSGLTALESERSQHPPGKNTWIEGSQASRHLQGSHLLLITDDARLQRDVAKVCQRLALKLDVCPTTRQATRFCELSTPHLLLIDENLHDTEFDLLHADLVRHHVRFPVIEIAARSEGYAVSTWDDSSASRIGRDAVVEQLPEVLTLELGKSG